MTWAELLLNSATLMNDSSQRKYTNTVLLPFLNMALLELEETFELNNVPKTNETSAVINVPAGDTTIAFGASPDPELPADLVEIQRLWQSQEGQNNWVPVVRKDFLTQDQLSNNTEVGYFSVWAWINQEIRLLAANVDLDIKLDYIKSIFLTLESGDLSDDLTVINSSSTLQYRVAALAAEFIAENPTRAASLNANAEIALNRSLGISTKGRQSIVTRRQPFRASWKRRGILV